VGGRSRKQPWPSEGAAELGLGHRPAGVAVTPDGRALLTADAANTEVHLFWLHDGAPYSDATSCES
jgi:sugar lactone lactonase YvrE